jgi:DNA-binding MurR/RpiR family transcriptional regulator
MAKIEENDNMQSYQVLDLVKEKYNDMFAAEKKVADYVLLHPSKVIAETVSDIAKGSGASEATVVRMCRHLGYKGYYQFRVLLAKDIGRLTSGETEEDAVGQIFNDYISQITQIKEMVNDSIMRQCADLLRSSKMIHILAVGNTVPLSLYMGFRLGRLGLRSSYGVAPEYVMNNVNLAGENEVLVAISKSGSSKQIVEGCEMAKEKNMPIIAVTKYEHSPITSIADLTLATGGKIDDLTGYHSNYSHLTEMILIDALLEFVTNWEQIVQTDAEKPEELFSKYKV